MTTKEKLALAGLIALAATVLGAFFYALSAGAVETKLQNFAPTDYRYDASRRFWWRPAWYGPQSPGVGVAAPAPSAASAPASAPAASPGGHGGHGGHGHGGRGS